MSRWPEPRRLLSRAPKDSAVGLALTAAHAREPGPAELRTLAASLLGLMDNPPGQSFTPGASAAVTPSATTARPAVAPSARALAAKLGLLAVLAGGIWGGLRDAPQGTPAPTATAVGLAKPQPPPEHSSQAVRT